MKSYTPGPLEPAGACGGGVYEVAHVLQIDDRIRARGIEIEWLVEHTVERH